MKLPRGCVDTIVSTYLYIDNYPIIWTNDYLCFRSIRDKDNGNEKTSDSSAAHQELHTTRVTRSKRGPRVSTTVEYKMTVMLFWSLYIFA